MQNVSFRLFLSFWWFVSCALFPFQLVNAQAPSSPSVSPGSVATSNTISPGVQRWTVTDPSFMAHVNGRTTIPDPTSAPNGDIKVRTPGNISTRNGNVPISVSRNIKYSDLIKPWKNVAKAVPLLGTALVIKDILDDMCIRFDSSRGVYQGCAIVENPAPLYYLFENKWRSEDELNSYVPPKYSWPIALNYYQSAANGRFFVRIYRVSNNQTYYTIEGFNRCNVSGPTSDPDGVILKNGQPICPVQSPDHYEDKPPGYDPGPDLDGYPSHPKFDPSRPPKLFDQLPDLQDKPGLGDASPRVNPTDEGSPQVTGPTDPVTGPSTTQSNSSGTVVTNNTSNVTYQGDITTVTNNTTVTYINNEGDVINQETTSDNQPTECEQNPTAISCQELGAPPSGEIPKLDQPWSITPESLPGGNCPAPLSATFAGKTHSISFTPLCNALPDVRMVVLLLSGVMAAWVVAGGLKS